MYTAGRVVDSQQAGGGAFCMTSPPLLAIDDDDVECEEDHCRDVTSAQAEREDSEIIRTNKLSFIPFQCFLVCQSHGHGTAAFGKPPFARM